MGTKAGVMPLHSWLPRAHPIAPAPVSALMSGVMIKVAIYGLVRVLVDWLGVLPLWFGVLVLALGALSAVGGVVYALFQHDLKRLLAFHSIENVGIIVLGLGACLLLRARGADAWAALALAAALLHTLNHAVFKSLLFLGAGAFERAVGSLELDRLGGLLRRMPWTGGAFLVGSLAIAGVPPLNGFASEWLTLAGAPARSRLRRARRRAGGRARARGARGDGRARGLLLRQGRRARPARPAAAGGGRRGDRGARCRCARRSSRSPAPASCSASLPGLLVGSLAGLAPWPVSDADDAWRCTLPGHRVAADGRDRARCSAALGRRCFVLRGRRVAAPAPTWVCGQLVQPQLAGRAPASRSRCGSCSRRCSGRAGDRGAERRAASCRRSSYSGRVPQLIDERLYAPAVRVGARRGPARASPADRDASAPTSPT